MPVPDESPHLNRDAWLIFAAGLLLFSSALFNREFMHLESRFALFAQEMMRNGLSLFPTLYQRPYPDYPATQTILIALLSMIRGKVTIVSAVLPTAVAAALTLSLTYRLGAIHSRRWGIYAVLFELLTYQFLASARSVALDPFISAATILCFYAAYSAKIEQAPARHWWIPVGLVSGFLFRGPIGVIIPAGVLCVFFLLEKDVRLLLSTVSISLGLLVVGMTGLLAAARHQGGAAFVDAVIHAEATGRVADQSAHLPLYYFINPFHAFALSFPVAVLVLGLYVRELRRAPALPEMRFLRHLAAWVLVIMAGLSIPTKQEIRYLLPIVPAVSLTAAYLFIAEPKNRFAQRLRHGIGILCGSVPFLGFAGAAICLGLDRLHLLPRDGHYLAAVLLFGLEAVLVVMVSKAVRTPSHRELAVVSLGAAAFLTLTVCITEPIAVTLNRVTPFVEQVEARRAPEQTIVFYQIGPDGADVKFMAALDRPVQPEFVRAPDALLTFGRPALFITTGSAFAALPPQIAARLHPILTGTIARTRCVAFTIERAPVDSPPPPLPQSAI